MELRRDEPRRRTKEATQVSELQLCRPAKQIGATKKETTGSVVWTESQLTRVAEVEAGRSVLASMRKENGVPVDGALIEWAESQNLAVRIDRSGDWGNPFEIGADGTREEVIERYREYLINNRSLRARIGELKGKVLICWCYPENCHGEILLEALKDL